MTPEKTQTPAPNIYIRERESEFFPPRIRWARELGWLLVRDPVDGTWHSIQAKDAPTGWVKIANEAKRGRA